LAYLHLNRFPTKQCIYFPQYLLRVFTLPCRNNIVRFLCCLKIKFAHELCWQTTKSCESHKIVLNLPAIFNMSYSQPKIVKFGWYFTKLYQFNIKEMETCSFLGHPVCAITTVYCTARTTKTVNHCARFCLFKVVISKSVLYIFIFIHSKVAA